MKHLRLFWFNLTLPRFGSFHVTDRHSRYCCVGKGGVRAWSWDIAEASEFSKDDALSEILNNRGAVGVVPIDISPPLGNVFA